MKIMNSFYVMSVEEVEEAIGRELTDKEKNIVNEAHEGEYARFLPEEDEKTYWDRIEEAAMNEVVDVFGGFFAIKDPITEPVNGRMYYLNHISNAAYIDAGRAKMRAHKELTGSDANYFEIDKDLSVVFKTSPNEEGVRLN